MSPTLRNFFNDPQNAEWFKRNAGETWQFIGRNVQEAANFVGRNIESIGRGIGKLFGFGGGDGPPPNLSSYVNTNSVKNFAQGFGKMGVQATIDGYTTILPGIDNIYHSFGGEDLLDLTPTDNQKVGYYTAMALTFISPAGIEGGIIKNLPKGGKTFLQHKIARGGTQTLDYIMTTNASGQRVSQRISTEFSHMFITKRIHTRYDLPNWLVNNRINIWKLNTVQHSLIDSYRFRFLRNGFKSEVGWFSEYNWFTKFPQ